ncbi:hypothetical protein [Niallia sp. 01092]|uniref:hypothetical protein n=1 Tax=unclassified Niallia TaxID=2837522 RepID=UPI003FD4DF4A
MILFLCVNLVQNQPILHDKEKISWILSALFHIQKFTGDTVLSIEQDFYATMFLANMAALVKQEADEIIAKEQNGKELKYEYTAKSTTFNRKAKR